MGIKVEQSRALTRKAVQYYAVAIASGTTGTETAITLSKGRGSETVTTSVAPIIPTGKTFAVNFIQLQHIGHTTGTTAVTNWSLRRNDGGAVATNTTPIILAARTATPPTAQAVDRVQIFFDPPMEIVGDGTKTFGITANSVFSTNAPTWDVLIEGYEY